jgi:hypothetical protein
VAKLLGYSNEINPFGDANLLTPFVWGKKKEEEKKKDKKSKKHSRERDDELTSESEKRIKLMDEIDKVRKRRLDREKELEDIERLREEEQRLREMSNFHDWQKKEEDFHREQIKERSKLRLLQHRESMVDRIMKNILLVETAEFVVNFYNDSTLKHLIKAEDLEFLCLSAELENSTTLINSVTSVDEVESLIEDITLYEDLYDSYLSSDYSFTKLGCNSPSKGISYTLYFENLLSSIKHQKSSISNETLSNTFHDTIAMDIKELLARKNSDELKLLKEEIRENIHTGKGTDIEYWETMLKEIETQTTSLFLHQFHIAILQKLLILLSQLKSEGVIDANEKYKPAHSKEGKQHTSNSSTNIHTENTVEDYLAEMEKDLDYSNDDSEIKMIASDEVFLPHDTTYWWHDKYRPRKPRYFNRVKTGWERNKYNLTHYDHDNPPPKVIQGYKFTIFYPDLIDKTVAPKYFLEPCKDCDNNEFVIIRFQAGPPYEDVAFKILNKEWDVHKRSGFVSVFDRGILQLHFNFKRAFYRR